MQQQLGEEEKILQQEQSKIEAELDTIQPEIDAALRAVGEISRNELAEVHALFKPPQAITEIMTVDLILLGEHEST